MGRYTDAFNFYIDALEIYHTLPDAEQDRAVCLDRIGLTLSELGRNENALNFYRGALEAYRTLPDTHHRAKPVFPV